MQNRNPGEYASPLGPGTEAIGQVSPYATNAENLSGAPSQNTTPVMKGSSKNSAGDPSIGTYAVRAVALERSGAAYRVHTQTDYAQPNHPSSALTEANGRVIDTPPGVTDLESGDHFAGTNETFNDAEEVAGRPAGSSRLHGYTVNSPRG